MNKTVYDMCGFINEWIRSVDLPGKEVSGRRFMTIGYDFLVFKYLQIINKIF